MRTDGILPFTKMQGCGNDYIYVNCFEQDIEAPEVLAVKLSNRHFGIGGDGLVLIQRSAIADARMRMFNADGSEGAMCGNAIRCVAKYLYENGLVVNQRLRIETLSGVKILRLNIENGLVSSVTADMGRALFTPADIPVNISGNCIIDYPLEVGSKTYNITCVSMGNPHAVVFCEDALAFPLSTVGPLFEKNPVFPQGVNTEFVEIINRRCLKMRVWERGSWETLACGTGACAAVAAAVVNGYCDEGTDVTVCLPGGELIINYTSETVLMTGDCIEVFDGTVDLLSI